VPRKRQPRKLKHFGQQIEIDLINKDEQDFSILEVNGIDQPGLLAAIGKVFAEQDIQLLNARIATLGERVEDLFYVTDENDQAITEPDKIEVLKKTLMEELTT
jgi:[protein-PII] uridylyltransferase